MVPLVAWWLSLILKKSVITERYSYKYHSDRCDFISVTARMSLLGSLTTGRRRETAAPRAALTIICGACLAEADARGRTEPSRQWHRDPAEGLGTGRAATRPSVTGLMDDPLFYHRLAAGVGMQYAAVREPTRYLAFLTRLLSDTPWPDCATTKSAFLGLTVVSLSPWKTIAGTTRGFDPAGPVCACLGAGPPLPCIAATQRACRARHRKQAQNARRSRRTDRGRHRP